MIHRAIKIDNDARMSLEILKQKRLSQRAPTSMTSFAVESIPAGVNARNRSLGRISVPGGRLVTPSVIEIKNCDLMPFYGS